jgi:hypothetical protein
MDWYSKSFAWARRPFAEAELALAFSRQLS